MSLHFPSAVKALPGHRVWLLYPDGVAGTVDLSSFAGHGVFQRWRDDPASFQSVGIAEDGSLLWDGEIDLCADALYLEITGKPAEAVFPGLSQEALHA
jgi:hypothetical protein